MAAMTKLQRLRTTAGGLMAELGACDLEPLISPGPAGRVADTGRDIVGVPARPGTGSTGERSLSVMTTVLVHAVLGSAARGRDGARVRGVCM